VNFDPLGNLPNVSNFDPLGNLPNVSHLIKNVNQHTIYLEL